MATDYRAMTVAALKNLAGDRFMTVKSKIRKDELVLLHETFDRAYAPQKLTHYKLSATEKIFKFALQNGGTFANPKLTVAQRRCIRRTRKLEKKLGAEAFKHFSLFQSIENYEGLNNTNIIFDEYV